MDTTGPGPSVEGVLPASRPHLLIEKCYNRSLQDKEDRVEPGTKSELIKH